MHCSCSRMDVPPDADDLSYLHHELYDLRSNWYNFGVQLNIDIGTLQSIKRQFTDDLDALREVLTHWLKGTPTWEELFKALQSRPVGAHDIQRKIEDHLSPESVPEAPVQYMSKRRLIRADSQVMYKMSPDGGIEQANPVYCPDSLIHVPAAVVESAISLPQEYSMMKMPSTKKKDPSFKFKVVIVGESGVGKTSILNRFLHPEIQVKSHMATVTPMQPEGSCFIEVDRAFSVQLTIWDTAGMERLFNSIPEQLFRDVDAALIVFDVRERKTFKRATSDHMKDGTLIRKSWFKVVNDRSGDIPPVKILVGNMIDCQDKPRKITEEKASEKALQLGIEYIEASSLENINIDKIFFRVTKLLVDRARSGSNSSLHPLLSEEYGGRRHYDRQKCHC